MHTDPNGMIGGEPLFGGDPLVRPANTIPNPSTRMLATDAEVTELREIVDERMSALHAHALEEEPPGLLSLAKACEIVAEIGLLRGVQDELKRVFQDDALNGGWKAALKHPLWSWAEQRIAELHEQMKELI